MEPSCKCHWHDTWICKKLCKSGTPYNGSISAFFRGILYNSGNHILLTFSAVVQKPMPKVSGVWASEANKSLHRPVLYRDGKHQHMDWCFQVL